MTENLKNIIGYTMLSGIPCIDPASIRTIDGYNVRDAFAPDTDADDAQLLANMTANGFIADKPLTVRLVTQADGKLAAYVIAGHRRLAAVNWINAEAVKSLPAKQAKARGKNDKRPIPGVTFIPEAKAAGGELRSPVEMSYDLELSNTGKPLSPAERGANILRLRSMGETDETIAGRLGIGVRWVKDLAKLGRSDPRLKALVKAGVIPPTTAILLERAHGAAVGTEIAVKAAAIAKAAGKTNATGKHVAAAEKAAGVAPKVGGKNKKGADTRATSKPVVVTVAKPAGAPRGATVVQLAGPFHLGKDLEDRSIFDANGELLCELPTTAHANAMLLLIGLGWGVMKGTNEAAAPAVAPSPAVAKPAGKLNVPAATPAQLAAEAEAAAGLREAAAAAKAEREAERVARVAAQVAREDAKRIAVTKANAKAAAALVAGKPVVAMAKANAAKLAQAAADAVAAADKAEREEAARIAKLAKANAGRAKANGANKAAGKPAQK